MKQLLKTNTVLTIVSVLNTIQGIGFFILSEQLTQQSFPEELLSGGGLAVGTSMHWPLATFCIVLGIITFVTRNIEVNSAKKLLQGIGLAYLFFLVSALIQQFSTPVNVPIPALVTLAVVAVLSLVSSSQK